MFEAVENGRLPVAGVRRIQGALTAGVEARVLQWVARRLPAWVSADPLTALALAGQAGAGLAYALSGTHRQALWLACVGLLVNWAGDSLDGTLARVRGQERPRFGFYLDHVLTAWVGSFCWAAWRLRGWCTRWSQPRCWWLFCCWPRRATWPRRR